MALAAMFSALEVVPLTLLTLDAWDFIKLTGTKTARGTPKKSIPHKWAFYFLMSVGFWNFVGAGIFGFLINMPVVSYFEAGTILTLNHGQPPCWALRHVGHGAGGIESPPRAD
jgi:nitric oxide reductase subunit B